MATTIQSDDTPDEMAHALARWNRKHEPPEWILSYLQRECKRKPKTVTSRQMHLRNYVIWLNDMGLDPENCDHKKISEFLWDLQAKGYAESTVIGHYRTLRHFYNYLTDWEEVIKKNPFEALSKSDFEDTNNGKGSDRAKQRKYIKYEEKEKLKENAPTPKLRNVLLIELAFQTGLREKELVKVELTDIDREDRRITVYGKGDKERKVFYQPSLDSLLDRYLNYVRPEFYYADESPYLFLSDRSKQLNRNRPGRIIKEAAENAGILKELPEAVNGNSRYWPTTHNLRHGHAIFALRSPEITLRDLQKQLGHHSLEVTEGYLDMIAEDRQRAYQSFGAHRSD